MSIPIVQHEPDEKAHPAGSRTAFRPASGPFGDQNASARPPARSLPSGQQIVRLAVLCAAGRLYSRTGASRVPRSLLLIRPDHLGDVLFLTPALHGLRRALPEARITLLVGPWCREVVRHNPDLDAVITCPFPGFERQPKTNLLAPYRLLLLQARELACRDYDAAVVLRFDHWWGAWLAAAAGIPRRIGYDRPETRPFLTHALPYVPGHHEVRQNAKLLATLAGGLADPPGSLRYRITPDDRAWAIAWLASAGITQDHRLVAIHPGAGAVVKQWPAAAWATVANALAELGARIVLTGGSGELALTAAISDQLASPPLDAAGKTTLGQLAALYERCAVVLGSDSGPLHLAVAVGVRTVHLYGPVPAAEFGPWGNPADHVVLTTPWACAPCHRLDWPADALAKHACIAAIQPEDVLQVAVDLLN